MEKEGQNPVNAYGYEINVAPVVTKGVYRVDFSISKSFPDLVEGNYQVKLHIDDSRAVHPVEWNLGEIKLKF